MILWVFSVFRMPENLIRSNREPVWTCTKNSYEGGWKITILWDSDFQIDRLNEHIEPDIFTLYMKGKYYRLLRKPQYSPS